jgi:quercetin dioxygenase-like cupin family protein
LGESHPDIYDRPITLRQLHLGETGAEHYLVRYPVGLQARRHRHTAAQTIVVVEGRLAVDGEILGPGGYCHFPGGVPMHHAPAAGESCLFVTIFDGPFDVFPVDGPG